jgi:Tol biopolymer transport system component
VYGGRTGRGWAGIDKIELGEGAEAVPVTAAEVGFFHRAPTWSPDGEWIVFTRSAGGLSGQLMRVSSAGGTPTPLLDEPEGVATFHPAFSADGRYVIHSSDRGGTLNLWRVPFDGGSAERITSGPGPDSSPGVSPDGRSIAFVNSRVDPRILVISPADGTTTTLAEFEGGTAWFPVASPDRRWIAFSRKPPSGSWSIFVMRREGGQARRVTASSLNTQWARFHPDGQSLLFFTWPGRQRIGRVNLDGTGLSWLTAEDVQAGYHDVSPDGAWLAYVRRRPGADGGEDIVVRDFDGGPERVVVPDGTLPAISPDGRMLCFAGARAFTAGIGVVELPDGEPRWLTDSGTWPTWMPDGLAVAYADVPPGGEQQAWVVSLDGGEPRRLGDFAWHGSHLPFDVEPETGELITTDETDVKSTIWLAEYD